MIWLSALVNLAARDQKLIFLLHLCTATAPSRAPMNPAKVGMHADAVSNQTIFNQIFHTTAT